MRIGKVMFVAGLTLVTSVFSCGKPEGSKESGAEPDGGGDGPDGGSEGQVDGAPGTINTGDRKPGLENVEIMALAVPEMLPPVAANTPGTLAIDTGASLALTGVAISCANYDHCGAPGPLDQACVFITDVKCRFFSESGPVQVKQILGNMDRTMNEMEGVTKDQYIPCLDPVGNKDGLEVQDGDQKVTFPPWATVKYVGKFGGLKDKAGADKAGPLDLGFEYEFNCISKRDGEDSWKVIGIKKDEAGKNIFTIGDMSAGPDYRNGGVGTIDDEKNVDYWGVVSTVGATDLTGLSTSNVVLHLTSNVATKRIEMTFTGDGVGPGCGMRMLSDKSVNYLLAEANLNMRGQCEVGDAGYDPGKDNQTFCLDVTNDDPEIKTVPDCDAADVKATQFSRPMLTVADVLPWEIHKLMTTPEGVPPLKAIPLTTPGSEGGEGQPGDQKK